MKIWKVIGGAALALAAYCGPASVTPSHAASFALYESAQLNYDYNPFVIGCDVAPGCSYWTGYYQLVNYTSDLKVIGFEVTNVFAGYVDPITGNQTVASAFVGGADWTAETSTTGDFVNAPKIFNEPTFAYYAEDQLSALGSGSWAGFSWQPVVQISSSVVVGYIDINDTPDVNGDRPVYLTAQFEALQITPLPAALPLMGSVLGGGFVIGRWRKRRRAARAAA
jgi:hypothetical protein